MRLGSILLVLPTALCLATSCEDRQPPPCPEKQECTETVVIPQVNDTYAPRDVQLKLTLDQVVLAATPRGWPPEEPINALVFFARWPGLEPFVPQREGNHEFLTIYLAVVPPDAISSRFDPSEERFSPHILLPAPSRIDEELRLLVRNVPVMEPGRGPVNSLYLPLDGSPLYIQCYDPGNGFPAHCSMDFLVEGLKKPPSAKYVALAGVGFNASQLASWGDIRHAVEQFVLEHGELVPFGSVKNAPR